MMVKYEQEQHMLDFLPTSGQETTGPVTTHHLGRAKVKHL